MKKFLLGIFLVFGCMLAIGVPVESKAASPQPRYHNGIEQVEDVLRYRNPRNNDYIFTISVAEGNNLSRMGWKYEGVAFVAATKIYDHIPVFRLYNRSSDTHFYTADPGERNSLIRSGWKDEGTPFTVPFGAAKPVYRLLNPGLGVHLLTTSSSERNNLIRNHGWKDEGIAFVAR